MLDLQQETVRSDSADRGHKLPSRDGQAGGFFAGVLLLLVLVLIGGYFVIYIMFGYTIPPGYIGVRQIKWGPFQGFSKQGLMPGAHWGIPGYSVVHLVPQAIQSLHFDRGESPASFGVDSVSQTNIVTGDVVGSGGSSGTGKLPALDIPTSDRATVDVDATVLARFYPGPGSDDGLEHLGPAELVTVLGPNQDDWFNRIRKTAEDELKRALGTIATSEFYDPALREEQVKQATQRMNSSLAQYGIKVEAVLLRRYTYRDGRIDQAIFQKNLQDQEERLNVQASRLAEAQATLEQVAAEWDAKIRTLQVDGENKARVVRSEGDLYESEKKASGDLEVMRSRAEVDRLKASALSQSQGAEVYVARELAGLLGSLKGGIVTDIDPYNLKEWTERLGVEAHVQ